MLRTKTAHHFQQAKSAIQTTHSRVYARTTHARSPTQTNIQATHLAPHPLTETHLRGNGEKTVELGLELICREARCLGERWAVANH